MTFTCKYCGRDTLSAILSERAHVCHRCGTLRAAGISLDVDLFWNQTADEQYFKELDKYK